MIDHRNEYLIPTWLHNSGSRTGSRGVKSSADADENRFWTEMLTTGNPDERLQAVRILGAFGPKAAPAVPALAAALHDEVPRIRRRAIGLLADLGPLAQAAVPDLIALLHEGEGCLRFWAVFTLGEIGLAAAAAVPSLQQILREEEGPRLRAVVRAALKKIASDPIKRHGGSPFPGRPHRSEP